MHYQAILSVLLNVGSTLLWATVGFGLVMLLIHLQGKPNS
jgi:hypothetical protein